MMQQLQNPGVRSRKIISLRLFWSTEQVFALDKRTGCKVHNPCSISLVLRKVQTTQPNQTKKPRTRKILQIIRRDEFQFPDKNQYREDVKHDAHIQLLGLNRLSTGEESLS